MTFTYTLLEYLKYRLIDGCVDIELPFTQEMTTGHPRDERQVLDKSVCIRSHDVDYQELQNCVEQ